jgi:hypothetical protein
MNHSHSDYAESFCSRITAQGSNDANRDMTDSPACAMLSATRWNWDKNEVRRRFRYRALGDKWSAQRHKVAWTLEYGLQCYRDGHGPRSAWLMASCVERPLGQG